MQECVEIVEGASTGAVVHDTNLPIFISLSISARRILSEGALTAAVVSPGRIVGDSPRHR
jgi:hypothetical protein